MKNIFSIFCFLVFLYAEDINLEVSSLSYSEFRQTCIESIKRKMRSGYVPTIFDNIILFTDIDGENLSRFFEAVENYNIKINIWQKSEEEEKLLNKDLADKNEILQNISDRFRKQLMLDVIKCLTFTQQLQWAFYLLLTATNGIKDIIDKEAGDYKLEVYDEIKKQISKIVTPEIVAVDPWFSFLTNTNSIEFCKIKEAVTERINKIKKDERRK